MKAERAMWAREARRLENQIEYRQSLIRKAGAELVELTKLLDELLVKIADDYVTDNEGS